MKRAGRTGLALAAMVVTLLAGCSQSPHAGAPSTSSSTTPVPVPLQPAPVTPTVVDYLPQFAMGPCLAVSVQATRPLDDVQKLLPAGFEAAPALGAQDAGTVAMDVYSCGNLTTPTVSLPPTVYGQVYTFVKRPDGRVAGAPDAASQEYVFRVLAGEDVVSAIWPAAGYDTRSGPANVSIDAPQAPVDTQVRTATASVGADYGMVAEGQTSLVPVPWAGSFARYTVLQDGSVLLWTGSYEVASPFSGQGSFQVAGDDPYAPYEVANNVPGASRLADQVSMVGMDLRRLF